VLGPTDDVPARTLPVMRAVSEIRFFDPTMLALARAVSERYVTPLATVLGAIAPPRVASEEDGRDEGAAGGATASTAASPPPTRVASGYAHGDELLDAIRTGGGARRWAVRPAPEDEASLTVEMVRVALAAERTAIVLVPEATPVPATASRLVEAFGEHRVALFIGGTRRERYRTWLRIARGDAPVVVGTRAAVFAPVRAPLGVLVVDRESHPAFRDERAPYSHAREVALLRAVVDPVAPVVALAALCPSAETAALGLPLVRPAGRRWPNVEVVRPGAEGRAPRVVQALREVRRAFVYAPTPGYGVAQVCRSCGSPAACANCGGLLRASEGAVRCIVCEADGRCAVCGSTTFGIRRGGAERVEEWVGRVATVRVARPARPRLPRASGEVLVGGPELVRDLGPGGLDLVAILDADQAAARPGLAARERALAVWMEAAGWARPHGSSA
jgi:primosomal protein N' (replication factor Y)